MSVMGLKVEWHYWEAAMGGPVASAARHASPGGGAAECTCLWNSHHHAVTEERGPATTCPLGHLLLKRMVTDSTFPFIGHLGSFLEGSRRTNQEINILVWPLSSHQF